MRSKCYVEILRLFTTGAVVPENFGQYTFSVFFRYALSKKCHLPVPRTGKTQKNNSGYSRPIVLEGGRTSQMSYLLNEKSLPVHVLIYGSEECIDLG